MPVFNENGATQVPSATAELAFMETGDNALKNCTPAQLSERLLAIGDFATAAKGVTNGDSHDHSGGDGAQIDHGGLAGNGDDDHAQYHNDARGDLRYAPIAKGVTNGDSHDHNGGDGAQIDHANLANKGTTTHAQIDAQIPTTDQKASLAARIAPSATNLMLTEGQGLSHVATLQALRDWAQGPIIAVFVQAHTTAGDGGHGQFRYVSGAAPSTYVDNNGTIIVPTGGNGSAAWLRVYSGAVNVRWFGAKGDSNGTTGNGTDDKAAFQAASDCVKLAGSGYSLTIPESTGAYRLGSAWLLDAAIRIVGDGVSPYIGAIAGGDDRNTGSWLYFDHTGKGINIDGTTDMSGIELSKFGTFRNQPTPAPAWAPTAHDYDIYIDNADVYVEDLMLLNPTKGIYVTNGTYGRLEINRLRGQAFQTMVRVDTSYDVVKIQNLHQWPFWADHDDIRAYTMANLDVLYFERNDNPMLSDIFTIFARSGLRLGKSATGKTSKIHMVNADFDRGLHGIWVDSTVNDGVTGQFQNITHQGETGVTGSKFIYIQGSNCKLSFGNIRTDYCDQNAVRIEGTANTITLNGATELYSYNQGGVGFPAIEVLTGNIIRINDFPAMSSGTRYGGDGGIYVDEWTGYTPTVTAATGTITTLGTVTGRYKRHNDHIIFQMDINITTNGTGADHIIASLPVAASTSVYIAQGREQSVSGKTLQGYIPIGSNCLIRFYDGTYPGADGANLVVVGTYQAL